MADLSDFVGELTDELRCWRRKAAWRGAEADAGGPEEASYRALESNLLALVLQPAARYVRLSEGLAERLTKDTPKVPQDHTG